MTAIDLDQRYTFDNFVVGQNNKLAAAAGRKVATNPGQAYNPLFIYSSSGLGKTHLLNAVAHHARRLHPNLVIVYDTLGHFLDEALALIQAGERDTFHKNVERIGFLLLDDVQFLAERRAAQEELLRAWDTAIARGGQIVLASDRPPGEINGLDERLMSRFSGGLIADIGTPDYETRVAIVNRKAIEDGQILEPGVSEALAKHSFGNVRELQGGLNKVFAIQDLDARQVTAAEIPALFGAARQTVDEFGGFLSDVSGTVTEVIAHTLAEARIAEAIMRWQGEGYSTRRLEAALASPPSEAEVDAFLEHYAKDVERLQQIEREIRQLEPNAPELARADLFRTPDRSADADELLQEVRERNRPLPAPPAGRSFDTLFSTADSFAVRAARAVAEQPGQKYNPFFVHGPEGRGKTTLLAALANELATNRPEQPVAFVHGKQFAAELIQAIDRNCVGAWRTRYGQAGAFVLDDVDSLIGTERAQEELFRLFEELKRKGAQLAFGSEAAPGALTELDDRLRTRLESGLVVAIDERSPDSAAQSDAAARRREWLAAVDATSTEGESDIDEWFLSREKVVWNWPYLEDWLIEDLE
jgi:chromosomal replication initiation ATPase DnaA